MDRNERAAGDLHILSICQMILAAAALGAALYWLRPVLLPFVLGPLPRCSPVASTPFEKAWATTEP